jgi:hypothetical protein
MNRKDTPLIGSEDLRARVGSVCDYYCSTYYKAVRVGGGG